MKKILVPCDFSKTAVEALKVANGIAEKSKGELLVVHAFELPLTYETAFGVQPYMFDPELLASIEERARENFDEIKTKVAKKGVKITFHTRHASVTAAIAEFLQDNAIDLVVMGTNGASGMTETLFGSNTEKIVRLSQVPVLAVRSVVDISTIKNIAVPNSLTADQPEFIRKIKELQEFFEATLHIVLVNTPAHFRPDAEAKKLLEEFASRHKLTGFTLNFRSDRTEEAGIMAFVSEIKADLVAMATHGRKGLAHLASGSIAEDVVNHLTCPVWTCIAKI